MGLAAIVLIGAVVRLTALDRIPHGFTNDEASYGYDAYCLTQTGMDRFGHAWPLFVRGFGDYNEAFYVYLVCVSEMIFGVNEFAVRLPAALAGTLTIACLFLLTRRLFGTRWALGAAFFLAISPWAIQLSRPAWRLNLFPPLFLLGWYFFLRALKDSRWGWAAMASWALSLYTYSSARVFVPLMIVGLGLIHRRQFWQRRQDLFWPVLGLAGFAAALGLFWISPDGMAQAKIVLNPNLLTSLANYLGYFSPEFLLVSSALKTQRGLMSDGFLMLPALVLVPAGIWALALRIPAKRNAVLSMGLWAVLYPIPAALTSQSLNHHRAIIGASFFAILASAGIWHLDRLRRAAGLRRAWSLVLWIPLFIFSGSFLYKYFFAFAPGADSPNWLFGMKQAITEAAASDYSIVIMNKTDGVEPDVHVLFNTRVPPALAQKQYRLDGTFNVGRFQIGGFTQALKKTGKVLVITRPTKYLVVPDMPERGYMGTIWKTVVMPDARPVWYLIGIDAVSALGDNAVIPLP